MSAGNGAAAAAPFALTDTTEVSAVMIRPGRRPLTSTSCAGCHGDARVSMKGVAVRYPAAGAAAESVGVAPRSLDDPRGSGRLLLLDVRGPHQPHRVGIAHLGDGNDANGAG
jgi:hypothetical protein